MKAGPARTRTRTRIGTNKRLVSVLNQDPVKPTGYEVRGALEAIVSDPKAPAAARVNAARTLAEMDGLIGRHQTEPDREAPSLASLSREALVEELERLRTVTDLGLVPVSR